MTDSAPPTGRNSPLQWILLGVLLLTAVAIGWSLLSGPRVEPPTDGGDTADVGLSPMEPLRLPADAWLRKDGIGFAEVPFDAARIEAGRAQLGRGPAPAETLSKPVLEAFFKLNHLDAEKASEAVRRPATNSLHIRLREMYGLAGKAGMLTFLDQTWPSFEAALRKLGERARADGRTIDELIASPGEELAKEIGWAGGFVILARQLELMDASGQVTERLWPLVQILYRYRWSTSLTGIVDPRELLCRDEYTLLTLWRLQEARNVPPDRRLRYAHEASLLVDGYPVAVAEGIVHFEANRKDLARSRFETAMQADPTLEPLLSRWLEQLAASPDGP